MRDQTKTCSVSSFQVPGREAGQEGSSGSWGRVQFRCPEGLGYTAGHLEAEVQEPGPRTLMPAAGCPASAPSQRMVCTEASGPTARVAGTRLAGRVQVPQAGPDPIVFRVRSSCPARCPPLSQHPGLSWANLWANVWRQEEAVGSAQESQEGSQEGKGEGVMFSDPRDSGCEGSYGLIWAPGRALSRRGRGPGKAQEAPSWEGVGERDTMAGPGRTEPSLRWRGHQGLPGGGRPARAYRRVRIGRREDSPGGRLGRSWARRLGGDLRASPGQQKGSRLPDGEAPGRRHPMSPLPAQGVGFIPSCM